MQQMLADLRAKLGVTFCMEIIMLISWAIWNTRNDYIFKGTAPSLYRCHKKFKDEMALLVHKAKRKSYSSIKN
jgi:hypothetical protein